MLGVEGPSIKRLRLWNVAADRVFLLSDDCRFTRDDDLKVEDVSFVLARPHIYCENSRDSWIALDGAASFL
jgi:hypothetical protein